jgi:acetoin utilization deacetylase AcuC-like enzyme
MALRGFLSRFGTKKYPFRFVYSDAYWMIDLGNHVFPAEKYRLIFENIVQKGAKKEDFVSPEPALDEDLLLVHSSKYLKKLKTGRLSSAEVMAMELPYSAEILDFSQLMVGGTILAAQLALENGLAVHIGGGFHHAFHDHGEGFCILNDVAVALRKMQKNGSIEKAMIVDCDVHQGNGTAEIFAEKKNVFTYSMHQMDIYPAKKEKSTLDVGLWSEDTDERYLKSLRAHFPRLFDTFEPELVFFLAGADPYEKDQLGGLKISMDGLRERDQIVIKEALRLKIPIVILFAGGYASDVKDTVQVHLNTIKVAQKLGRKYL